MNGITAEAIARILGTILTHGFTLYVLSKPAPSIRYPKLVWFCFSVMMFFFSSFVFYITESEFLSFKVLMIFMIILYALVFACTSSYSIIETLFILMCDVICFMLCVLLANCLSVYLFNNSVWSSIVIRNFLSFLLLLLIVKVKEPLMVTVRSIHKGWGSLLLFAILAGLIVSYISLSAIFISLVEVQLIVFTVMIVLMGASFAVVFSFIRLMNETERIDLMRVKQKLLENELIFEKRYADSYSRQISDMHQHNLKLLKILENNDAEKAIRYLSAYDESVISSETGNWCGNRIVNALLRITAGKCEENEIDYQFRIRIPEELPVSDPEFTIVLGNILENAYEAASNSVEPFIVVNMTVSHSSFLIEIRNSVKEPVLWNGLLPYTTKTGGGMGLRSVQLVVERHNGVMECSNSDNVFVTRILLPMPERNVL